MDPEEVEAATVLAKRENFAVVGQRPELPVLPV